MSRKKTSPKSKVAAPPEYPRVLDVFGNPRYHIDQMSFLKVPTCFNGMIRLQRYRITVEEVDEPIEVQRERLIHMWRTSERNHHHWSPFKAVANQLGMDFERDLGLKNHGIEYKR